MRRIGIGIAGLCAALTVSAQPVMGTFLYGRAVPIGTSADARFAQITFEFESCGTIVRTRWYDAQQTLVAADELETPSDRFSRYRFWRPNLNEWGRITRSGALLKLERHAQADNRTAQLSLTNNTVVGPMMVMAAARALPNLQPGRSLQMSYVASEQLAAYEFSAVRVASDGGGLREIELQPTSWVVRQFVHPIELYFDREGVLTRMRGRGLPMTGTSARREPLDIDAQVDRRESHLCSPQPASDDSYQLDTLSPRSVQPSG